jgi:hypothetical protein
VATPPAAIAAAGVRAKLRRHPHGKLHASAVTCP